MEDNENIFGNDDDDDDDNEVVKQPTSSKPSKSSGVFGDSDDDDDKPAIANKEEYDDLFGGDDEDDDANDARALSKLKQMDKITEADIFGNDDDEQPAGGSLRRLSKGRKDLLKRKKDKGEKKKDKKRKLHGDEEEGKRSKPKRSKESKSGGSEGAKADKEDASSGDEYDSGEEVKWTKEDARFLDRDDDLADIMREYDEDGDQKFDDERGSSSRKGKGRDGADKTKSNDPLTAVLSSLKKTKSAQISETDKAKIVSLLLSKMDAAARKDDELYNANEPAIHKLQLLPQVKSLVSLKDLQNTLLDYDILAVFKDWIEPKDANTLPSLAVRSAVYEMLHKLPCAIEHLKRVSGGKQPIGATIVSLRKHKMETNHNKQVLKELMEKWSRPIFSKSIDARSQAVRAPVELLHSFHSKGGDARGTSVDVNNSNNTLSAIISNSGENSANPHMRVSAPRSYGFLFTVDAQQTASADNSALGERKSKSDAEKLAGDNRNSIMNRMKEGKNGSIGKKNNTRAVQMNLAGRIV